MKVDQAIRDWLEHFAGCVRNRVIESGRRLFVDDVHAFGARIEQAWPLDELSDNQWQATWFNTRDFCFLQEAVRTVDSDDGSLVGVLALWESQGVRTDGALFPRRARCTIVLRRHGAVPPGYKAVHTHFSKSPDGQL
jgi:ketosteroid isomerase-like protein